MRWPNGASFAFTIVDDTDWATSVKVAPVYDLLQELGIRATKTVWPFPPLEHVERKVGETLSDPGYLSWIRDLQAAGFEIAYHGTSDGPNDRSRIRAGLDHFEQTIGHPPRLHVNHARQLENMYWGPARLTGSRRTLYNLASRIPRQKKTRQTCGEVEGSPYFWGDLCRDRIDYVRNFTFHQIDTLAVDPIMPYHDPRKPFVKRWFSSSDGATVGSFLSLLSDANLASLTESGGGCVVYTHFAARGFVEDGRILPSVERALRAVAACGAWCPPASELLDVLVDDPERKRRRDTSLMPDLRRLERRWLLEKLRRGST